MSDITDDMRDDATAWAYDSQVCERGHRFIPSEWGCPVCETENETDEEWCARLPERGERAMIARYGAERWAEMNAWAAEQMEELGNDWRKWGRQ